MASQVEIFYDLTKHVKHCYTTMEDIIFTYYAGKYSEDYLVEDFTSLFPDPRSGETNRLYPNTRENLPSGYPEYVIARIQEELNDSAVVGLRLENGTGQENDQTFDHSFVLIQEDGNVTRLESYVDLYCTRIVASPHWQDELRNLLQVKPGKRRLALWNKLFDADEKQDTPYPSLDVTLYGKRRS